MTRAGFGFIAAGLFIYLAAAQTQIGWFYLFDAIIWSLLVLSAILPWYSLKSLQVQRQILLPAHILSASGLAGPLEDETVEVKLKLTNNGRIARHFITILENCPFDRPENRGKAFFVSSIGQKSTAVFSYWAICYQRGFYASSNIILESSGPLGLIVRRRALNLPLNLTVYPAYYQMDGVSLSGTAWVDSGSTIRSRAANEFYSSREYQYGEPLKYIHWRNTARLGHFMLKEFEHARQSSVLIAFETRHDFGIGRETTLEYSIKITASLVKICADSGHGIDIIAGETPLRNAGWREAMDYLAHLEIGGKFALGELIGATEAGQILVVIVPATETRLVSALSQLSESAAGLVVVLLEGFATDEKPHEFTSGLKSHNLDIIQCSQGNLGDAIKGLGNSLLLANKLQV